MPPSALREFLAARHRQAAVVVRRAEERGELPSGTDAQELIRVAVAPVYYRLFVTHEPVSAQDVERAADAALAAARTGVLQGRSPWTTRRKSCPAEPGEIPSCRASSLSLERPGDSPPP